MKHRPIYLLALCLFLTACDSWDAYPNAPTIEETKNCVWVSEDPLCYFVNVSPLGDWGQIKLNETYVNIQLSFEYPHSDYVDATQLDGVYGFINDSYTQLRPDRDEDILFCGSVSFTENEVIVSLERNICEELKNSVSEITFNQYDKGEIDLKEYGFTTIFSFQSETKELTVENGGEPPHTYVYKNNP